MSLPLYTYIGIRLDPIAVDVPAMCVYVTQVIHHLDSAGTSDYPNVRKFIAESFRVLKEGGTLLINIHSREQFESMVIWYCSLLPKALKREANRYMSIVYFQ